MRRIRPARSEEADTVRALVRTAFSIYVPRLGREPRPMVHDWGACIAADEVIVAEDDGGVVTAVLRLVDEGDALLVDTVAVHPDHQGHGLGRRLLAVAEEEGRRCGHRRLRLYTNVLMTENIALYTRLGWTATHEEGEAPMRRVFMEMDVA